MIELEVRVKSLEKNLTIWERELAATQSSLIANVLDNAIAGARILPAERQLRKSQLTEDFHNASAALANAKPQLKTSITTSNLSRVDQVAAPNHKTQKAIQKLINEKMRNEGLTYHQAWVALKEDKPELFANLSIPA